MSKMIILRGLPASGKSTKAQELMVAHGNAVRINKDLLRTMLHFDKFTGINEGHTRDAARKLSDWFLSQNMNVIIDDTNLNPGVMQSWKDLAKIHNAKVEVIEVDTDWETCCERDLHREKSVGAYTIMRMAMQYGMWKPEKGVVIVDIDGTVADCTHRQHFVRKPDGEKKDWKSFFEGIEGDTLREDVWNQVKALRAEGYDIVFVSGRPDTYRKHTQRWMQRVGIDDFVTILMRPGGDSRDDTIVKQEIYEKCLKKYNVVKVFDDRPSVIRMWRDMGLDVVDVGKGEEF